MSDNSGNNVNTSNRLSKICSNILSSPRPRSYLSVKLICHSLRIPLLPQTGNPPMLVKSMLDLEVYRAMYHMEAGAIRSEVLLRAIVLSGLMGLKRECTLLEEKVWGGRDMIIWRDCQKMLKRGEGETEGH